MIVLSAGVLCGWIPDFLACDYTTFATTLPLYATFVLMLANAYGVFLMMRRIGVLHFRDFFPVFLYLLTTTAFPAIHTRWQLQVAVMLTMFIVQIIHRAYHEDDTAHDSFLATALALIASLVIPIAIVMVPLIWLSYILFRAMHLRTFIASLIAIALLLIYLALTIHLWHIPCPYAELFTLPDWQTFIGIAHADATITTASPDIACALGWLYILFIAIHYAFCICAIFHVEHDSAAQQSLLTLLFFFFLPTATAVFFFRQQQSLARGITFIFYVLLLLTSYTLYHCV